MNIPLDIPEQPFPEKGDILLAEPFLRDSKFKRSVIYLCEVNLDGAYGVIMNQPLPVHISDIIDDFPNSEIKANYGGPVSENQLFYIHNLDQLNDAEEINEQHYFGGSFDELKNLFLLDKITEQNVRFFVGYAGWSYDQLMDEINEKSWVVYKQPTHHTILNVDQKDLWRKLMLELGEPYTRMVDFPFNFEQN